jgi:hypothetical protein
MMDAVGGGGAPRHKVGQDCEREERGILGLILILLRRGCERMERG